MKYGGRGVVPGETVWGWTLGSGGCFLVGVGRCVLIKRRAVLSALLFPFFLFLFHVGYTCSILVAGGLEAVEGPLEGQFSS